MVSKAKQKKPFQVTPAKEEVAPVEVAAKPGASEVFAHASAARAERPMLSQVYADAEKLRAVAAAHRAHTADNEALRTARAAWVELQALGRPATQSEREDFVAVLAAVPAALRPSVYAKARG